MARISESALFSSSLKILLLSQRMCVISAGFVDRNVVGMWSDCVNMNMAPSKSLFSAETHGHRNF